MKVVLLGLLTELGIPIVMNAETEQCTCVYHMHGLRRCAATFKLLALVLALSHGDFTTHLRFPAQTLALASLRTDSISWD